MLSKHECEGREDKFGQLLDQMAVVDQKDLQTAAVENAVHMTDFEAVKLADLMCDFYYELGDLGEATLPSRPQCVEQRALPLLNKFFNARVRLK